MSQVLFIPELIEEILRGTLRIPSFQRGFVWDADKVAYLMDSIYKGYPFGTLLLWRTRTPLQSERQLGPFLLPERDDDYPIDYVLDGQQRITSIFGVFQNQLKPLEGEDRHWTEIYFDLWSNPDVQASQFVYLPTEEADPERYFPLRTLFDSSSYRRAIRSLDDTTADRVDEMYRCFNTAKIPVQIFKTEDRTKVAIVFERINRLGVELDTLQLLSAWTWSEEFDLLEQFRELSEELEPYGFRELGQDSDLLLRCCAAVLRGNASPKTLMNLQGAEVRARFSEVRNGLRGAIDFLRTELSAYSLKILPYPSVLVPLSVFFATTREKQDTHPDSDTRKALLQWFWRLCFSRRYSKGQEELNLDIQEMWKLKKGRPHRLAEQFVTLDASYFLTNQFRLGSVDTKTYILLLAQQQPLNFVQGGRISLSRVLRDCNRREFHHLFPRQYLKRLRYGTTRINCLSNTCMLSKADNNRLGGRAPSLYRESMPADDSEVRRILFHALCPQSLFSDNYDEFLRDRTQLLLRAAMRLMQGDS
jgi:hypothetical protein